MTPRTMVYSLIYPPFIFPSLRLQRWILSPVFSMRHSYTLWRCKKTELETSLCIGECSTKWYLAGIMIGIPNSKAFLNCSITHCHSVPSFVMNLVYPIFQWNKKFGFMFSMFWILSENTLPHKLYDLYPLWFFPS